MRIELRFGLLAASTALLLGCGSAFQPAYGVAPYPGSASAPGPAGAPASAYVQGQGGSAPNAGEAAVAFARARLETPYCWGGTGPGCYDCSGLTFAAWRFAGKAIPRTSEAQRTKLPTVAMDRLQLGDILWRPGHVGIYAGNGWAIHAPQGGGVVSYQPANRFQRAVRP